MANPAVTRQPLATNALTELNPLFSAHRGGSRVVGLGGGGEEGVGGAMLLSSERGKSGRNEFPTWKYHPLLLSLGRQCLQMCFLNGP